MKFKTSDFNNFLKVPNTNISSFLIYGQDAGQVSENARKITKALSITESNINSYDIEEWDEKAPEIFSFAKSPSLLGGRRAILIKYITDTNYKRILPLLQLSGLDAIIIIQSYEQLSTKSDGVRALFEKTDNFGCIACYLDDGQTLSDLIKQLFAQKGITKIDNDAIIYMTKFLGNNREMTKSYIEKISIYVDDSKRVTLEDAEKCIGDSGDDSHDKFMHALLCGDVKTSFYLIDRLLQEEPNYIELVRIFISFFKNKLLIPISAKISLADAIRSSKILFKYEQDYKKELQIWKEADVILMLNKLNDLEKKLKTTGMPNKVIFSDFCLKLSLYSAKLAKKNKGH